ncbi:kinase-like domain-containing protein [Crucibulum laeve]|uniref:Kinase-like domain-containing protein n=1 Tax=Crucibulum laeve TaxID=68775 RepID=A0A5C3LE51_9AGAR|nr:kinase-like domain-containing protein [Crucibulum laeve]
MQMLLDHSLLEAKTKNALLIALFRLSSESTLYPQCFTLSVTQGANAVTAGHFGEISKGCFRGQALCLRVIKLYRKSHVESLLKACSKAAILWGHLSHPNVLPFYGIYHLEDNHRHICLISPWMDNGNITQYLIHNPNVSRFSLVHDTAAGILYLHENDIVHGNLRGTNILVTSSGRTCLADFGTSAVADAYNLQWKSIQKTVHTNRSIAWQAPEIRSSKGVKSKSTKSSDIYAFSSVCYEIFTGMAPFYDIPRDATVMLHVMSRNQPPPEITLPAKNGSTNSSWQLMEECWKTDPVRRPTIQTIYKRLSMDGPMVDDRSVDGGEVLPPTEFRKAMHNPANHFPYEDLRDISTWLPDL